MAYCYLSIYDGTFHHFSKKDLEKYINEFAFRPNEGNYQIDTIDRMKSLAHGIGGVPPRKLLEAI